MDSMEMRRDAIVQLINEKGTVRFVKLDMALRLVSRVNLGVGLKRMDEQKTIWRLNGVEESWHVSIGTEYLLKRKSVGKIPEKQESAKKALTLLRPDTTFFLDSGSTATAFARQIPDQSYLIYTTGLSCATELANLTRPTVMLPGGRLNRYSQSVFGYSAIRELERVNFDQAFLGVTGFHPSVGFSCGISDEALLKQTAIHQSGQVIALMDSSKVDIKCSFSFCSLSDVDIVVSDGKLPEEFLEECRKYGVQVL